MSDIPNDVIKAAKKAHTEFADNRCLDNLGTIIARAILAERERCAKIAETRHEIWRFPHPDDAQHGEVCDGISACADIAAAIRRGDKP